MGGILNTSLPVVFFHPGVKRNASMTPHTSSKQQIVQLPHPRVLSQDAVVLFGEVLADVFPDKTVLGGAPFNVARHLKAFGLSPIVITRLGSDALGNAVLEVMSQSGMATLGVQRCEEYPTGRVQVHMQDGAHQFEILPVQAYDFIDQAAAKQAATAVKPALVYFGTLAQRHAVSRQALIALLGNVQAAKFLDINLRTGWYEEKTLRRSLQDADIIKLNADELAVLAKIFALTASDPKAQVGALLDTFDISEAVITCGDAGAWQINRNGKMLQTGVKKRAASMLVDTVGAGDGFSAIYILGTLRQWPLATILERANDFASAICGLRGAVPDDLDFYQPFYISWSL